MRRAQIASLSLSLRLGGEVGPRAEQEASTGDRLGRPVATGRTFEVSRSMSPDLRPTSENEGCTGQDPVGTVISRTSDPETTLRVFRTATVSKSYVMTKGAEPEDRDGGIERAGATGSRSRCLGHGPAETTRQMMVACGGGGRAGSSDRPRERGRGLWPWVLDRTCSGVGNMQRILGHWSGLGTRTWSAVAAGTCQTEREHNETEREETPEMGGVR